ncbi:hypothetical protein HZH68_006160 [Vespula germanica]|uniref:Uncharacterized protein n=1 Tax=Vespula germanica TaxID=30212 RepID=A0A834KG80_VESGE|nr:hypothetical protein HZH68_006160 [Vespula germanica]
MNESLPYKAYPSLRPNSSQKTFAQGTLVSICESSSKEIVDIENEIKNRQRTRSEKKKKKKKKITNKLQRSRAPSEAHPLWHRSKKDPSG